MKKRYTAHEMRDMAEQILHTDDDWYEDAGHMLLQAADMMERESTSEKSSAVGNAAKRREALDVITRIDTRMLKRLLCELVETDIFDGGQISKTISAVEKARQALSAPPRNCDVGSAEEQTRRFVDFCYRSKECVSCQMEPKGETDCILAWAQSPFRGNEEVV